MIVLLSVIIVGCCKKYAIHFNAFPTRITYKSMIAVSRDTILTKHEGSIRNNCFYNRSSYIFHSILIEIRIRIQYE